MISELESSDAVSDTAYDYSYSTGQDINQEPYILDEDISGRNLFEKRFFQSDGTFVSVLYSEPIHYLNDDGNWVEVDNTLSVNQESTKIVSANERFRASFAKDATRDQLVTLETDHYTLSWSLSLFPFNAKDADLSVEYSESLSKNGNVRSDCFISKDAEPIIENNPSKATGKAKLTEEEAFYQPQTTSKLYYYDAFGVGKQVDLRYTLYHGKIEEDIIYNSLESVSAVKMELDCGTLNAELQNDGSVLFLDDKGVMQFRIAAPYLCDASDEVSYDVDVSLEQNGSSCIITYNPSSEWMLDPDRSYPVLLDPSITSDEYRSSVVDTYVEEGSTTNHSGEQKFYAGIKNSKIYRAYIKFNSFPSIPASTPVTGASLTVTLPTTNTTGYGFNLYSVQSKWDESVTWANQPAKDRLLASVSFKSSQLKYSFDVTNEIQNIIMILRIQIKVLYLPILRKAKQAARIITLFALLNIRSRQIVRY